MSGSLDQNPFHPTRYVPILGASITGLMQFVLTTFSAAVLIGVVAGFVGRFIFIPLLFPAAMGFGFIAVVGSAVVRSKVRLPVLGSVIVIVGAALMLASMHYVHYWQFQKTMEDIPMPVRRIAARFEEHKQNQNQLPPNFKELLDKLDRDPEFVSAAKVQTFAGYIDWSARQGVRLINISGGPETRMGYVASYIHWLIEFIIIAAIPIEAVLRPCWKPFCGICHNWKDSSSLSQFDAPVELLRERLLQGDLVRLREMQPVDSGGIALITLYECPNCGPEAAVEFALDERRPDRKGGFDWKELVCLTYPGESLLVARNLFPDSMEAAPQIDNRDEGDQANDLQVRDDDQSPDPR